MKRESEKRKRARTVLEPLRKRLEQWRNGHRGWRVQIPEELWRDSAKAAREHGISAVTKILRLDYKRLKERTGIEGACRGKKTSAVPSTFIELRAPGPDSSSANAIEIQRSGGSSVRIEFKNEMTVELSRLSERLWRAAR